jgi:hypothetical protein
MSNVNLSILPNLLAGVDEYKVSRFGESINDHPNRVKIAGRNKLQSGVSFVSSP